MLLEILIALILVMVCAVPLIVEPIYLYRSELKLLEEVEGERLADWTFLEIKEKLLKNEIPWKALPSHKGRSISYSLDAAPIQIPGRSKKIIKRRFTLKCQREKEGPKGEIYRIFDVKIYFDPRLSSRKMGKKKRSSDYLFKLTARSISA